jgi:pyruvate formate lyase activating enzyme
MIVGGIQPLTLLDYPGKVAITIFTIGCNFRCKFCYNPELVIPEKYTKVFSMNDVWGLIKSRKDLADAVCITGGEPTLHSDLPEFIKKLRDIGLLVKLDTNGTNPEMLAKLLDQKILDYVAMDIKSPWAKYKGIVGTVAVEKIRKSATMILNSHIDHEFRATVVPELHSVEDIIEMAQQIKGADKFYIQRFKPVEQLVDENFIPAGKFMLKELNEIRNQIKSWFKICGVR